MSEWKECKLGDAPIDIIDGDRGKNYPSKKELTNNGYCLFLSTKNVRSNGFDFLDCQFISKEKDSILRKGKLARNDIILTTRGTIGNIGIFNNNVQFENIRINSGMVIIRPQITYTAPTFLFYLFRNLQSSFSSFTSGSAQPQLPIKDLSKIQISLPPIEEQRAIGEVLSSLDDKIDLLNRQNKTLEEMASALFRHHFIDNPQDDWKEKPLDEIAEYLNGLACQKIPPENDTDKLPVLKIKELRNGFSNDCDWAKNNVPKEYIINNGDVIFSWSGSLLVKIWNGCKCVLNQHLFKVTSKLYPKWFYYLWTQHYLDKFTAIAETKATTMGHIKRADLSSSMVLVPNNDEITNMNSYFSPLFDKLENNAKQIQTLEKLRDTLLPKLISGEIRVNF